MNRYKIGDILIHAKNWKYTVIDIDNRANVYTVKVNGLNGRVDHKSLLHCSFAFLDTASHLINLKQKTTEKFNNELKNIIDSE